jgi:hypothetical protein
MGQVAQVQLRSLEELCFSDVAAAATATLEGGSPSHQRTTTTRSTALMGLWKKCEEVHRLAATVISGVGDGGEREGSGMVASQPPLASSPLHPVDSLSSPSRRRVDPVVGEGSFGIRPGTQVIRYPAAIAAFLGPNQHHRGRAMMAEDEQLTAKLLQNVLPTDLTAIAHKKRLFTKRYGLEEGDRRFALWMKAQGAEWTVSLYRTLEDKKLTLLEMLKYQ